MARGRGRRTDYTWSGFTAGIITTTGQTSFASTGVLAFTGTLMRTRGNLVTGIDGSVSDDKVIVGMGIIKATEEQLAVGVTALPSPVLDLDAEWLWHSFGCLQAQGTDQGAPGTTQRFEIDSKAMRRMKANEGLALVVFNEAIAGSAAIDTTVGLRFLLGS